MNKYTFGLNRKVALAASVLVVLLVPSLAKAGEHVLSVTGTNLSTDTNGVVIVNGASGNLTGLVIRYGNGNNETATFAGSLTALRWPVKLCTYANGVGGALEWVDQGSNSYGVNTIGKLTSTSNPNFDLTLTTNVVGDAYTDTVTLLLPDVNVQGSQPLLVDFGGQLVDFVREINPPAAASRSC